MILAPHAVVVKSVSRNAMLVAAASLLAGCISLFPQTEPAQLYRFGATTPQVQEATSG